MPQWRCRLQKRDHGINHLAILVWLWEKGASLRKTRSHHASYRLTTGVKHWNAFREPADLQSAFKLVVQGYVGEDQVERLTGQYDRLGLPKARGGDRVMSGIGKDRLSVHEDYGLVFYHQDVCH